MLGSYMEDIGITSGQFEEACGKGSGKSFQQGLFEQVKECVLGHSISVCVRFGLRTISRSSSG